MKSSKKQKRPKKSLLNILNDKSCPKTSPFRFLIELNKEKKLRERRERILAHLTPRTKRIGTLILGVRCKDGIVIGSDRKVMRGGETEFTNKIFEFDIGGKILFAAEGLTGIRDDFFLLLTHEISRRRGVDTLYEVKIIVEDIISELTERYKERIREPYPIGVIMGGLEKLSEGKAVLYYIYPQGYGEQVSFRCAGHGGDYAYSIAKFLCDPHMVQGQLTVEEVAKRVAFIIAWIAEDVDATVGGKPHVVIIRDEKPLIEQLSTEDIHNVLTHVKETKRNFPNILFPHK